MDVNFWLLASRIENLWLHIAGFCINYVPLLLFKRRLKNGGPSFDIDIRSNPLGNIFSQTSLSVCRFIHIRDFTTLTYMHCLAMLTQTPFTFEGWLLASKRPVGIRLSVYNYYQYHKPKYHARHIQGNSWCLVRLHKGVFSYLFDSQQNAEKKKRIRVKSKNRGLILGWWIFNKNRYEYK